MQQVETHCKIGKLTHKRSGLVVRLNSHVNDHLVKQLKDELDLAKSGEVQSIAFVSIRRDGVLRIGRSVGNGHKLTDIFLAAQIRIGGMSA